MLEYCGHILKWNWQRFNDFADMKQTENQNNQKISNVQFMLQKQLYKRFLLNRLYFTQFYDVQ